ncbi:hypothetical protein O0L34_g3210 [Tuta absoluta]|nr:hypothetical protein O0L34_g3210 [Tuta absoluta]
MKKGRVERDSSSEINIKNISNATRSQILISPVIPTKRPKPKFYDIDNNENDFRAHAMIAHNKFMDSGEQEDEDFNLDDYDFDVNHDEYASRGKPLEPRLKNKNMLEQLNFEDSVSRPKAQQSTKTVSKRHDIAVKAKSYANGAKEDY